MFWVYHFGYFLEKKSGKGVPETHATPLHCVWYPLPLSTEGIIMFCMYMSRILRTRSCIRRCAPHNLYSRTNVVTLATTNRLRAVNLHALSVSLTPGHYFSCSHAKHVKSLAWMEKIDRSRQACKISRIKETITFFFFCLLLFLKVKTDTQFDRRRRKNNCKLSKYYYFFFISWFLTPSSSQKLTALQTPATILCVLWKLAT